jgi:hypothetical protein
MMDAAKKNTPFFPILLYQFFASDLLIFMANKHYVERHYHPNGCTFSLLPVLSVNFFPSIYVLYTN